MVEMMSAITLPITLIVFFYLPFICPIDIIVLFISYICPPGGAGDEACLGGANVELELDELGQVVAVGVREQEEDQGEGVEHQDLVLQQPFQRVPDQLEAWRQLVALCDVGWQSEGNVLQIQMFQLVNGPTQYPTDEDQTTQQKYLLHMF